MPGLTEVTVLRDEPGWTDTQIGEILGLHFSNVFRRRVNGFSTKQVERMRQSVAAGEQFRP